MDKEYRDNQRKQKKTFKKFRKYIKKILLWAGIGIASAAFFPGAAVMNALTGLIGSYYATSAAFFAQWGITAIGFGTAAYNGYKAYRAANTIDDLQGEEENTVDVICRDRDDAVRKYESVARKLENVKNKETNENEQTNDADISVAKVEKNGRVFTVYKNNNPVQNAEQEEVKTQETEEKKQLTKAS